MKVEIQRVSRRPNWPLAPVVVTVVWLALVAAGACWGEYTHREITLCPFRRLTGLPCPGCGSTRAVMSLLHGEPAKALAWNPLVTAALCLFAGVAALRLGAARKVHVELGPVQRRIALAGLVGLFLANWVYVLLWVG